MSDALDIGALDDLRRLGVAELVACDVVEVRIDGAVWLAGFVVDKQEHTRRLGLGMGAVTDRRVLHALWAMPEDVALDESSLSAADVETLRVLGQPVVDRADGRISRVFRPAGSVRSAIVTSSRADDAIRRVSQLPAIYHRLAVVRGRASGTAVALARRRGVGLVAEHSGRVELHVQPPAPILGSPAVYRWWVSELAYERWSYAHCAQWTS